MWSLLPRSPTGPSLVMETLWMYCILRQQSPRQGLLLPLPSLSLLRTRRAFRSHSTLSDGSHFSYGPAYSLSLALHLVLAETYCDLHICMVQILQRLSLWLPFSLFYSDSCRWPSPLKIQNLKTGFPLHWGNCQPSTPPTLFSDTSLRTPLPLKCFLTSLSKLVNFHVLFLVPSLYFTYCSHRVWNTMCCNY